MMPFCVNKTSRKFSLLSILWNVKAASLFLFLFSFWRSEWEKWTFVKRQKLMSFCRIPHPLFYSGVKKFSGSVMSSKYVWLDLASLQRIEFKWRSHCSMNQDSINQDFYFVLMLKNIFLKDIFIIIFLLE